jgi:hypothetical protein
VSDVFRHWSGTGKSYRRKRFDIGSERVKFLATVMCHLYRSNAEDVERIRGLILSDDISDDDSIDDGAESDENYVEPRDDSAECTDDATADDGCCSDVEDTDGCFHRKGRDEVW